MLVHASYTSTHARTAQSTADRIHVDLVTVKSLKIVNCAKSTIN